MFVIKRGDHKSVRYSWQCRCAILRRATPRLSAENHLSMRSPFYQANFCAECGNSLAPRSIFRSRYFCDACAARLNQRRLVTPLAGLLFIASLVIFGFSYDSYRKSRAPISQTVLSAQDSAVHSKPPSSVKSKLSTASETGVLCGARTLRGTPCRRRVQPGERCAQHRGRPSMLNPAAKLPPAESGGKSREH